MSKLVSNVIALGNIPNRNLSAVFQLTFVSSPSRLTKMSIILLSLYSVCVKLTYVVGINKLQLSYSIVLFPAFVWISIFVLVVSMRFLPEPQLLFTCPKFMISKIVGCPKNGISSMLQKITSANLKILGSKILSSQLVGKSNRKSR